MRTLRSVLSTIIFFCGNEEVDFGGGLTFAIRCLERKEKFCSDQSKSYSIYYDGVYIVV